MVEHLGSHMSMKWWTLLVCFLNHPCIVLLRPRPNRWLFVITSWTIWNDCAQPCFSSTDCTRTVPVFFFPSVCHSKASTWKTPHRCRLSPLSWPLATVPQLSLLRSSFCLSFWWHSSAHRCEPCRAFGASVCWQSPPCSSFARLSLAAVFCSVRDIVPSSQGSRTALCSRRICDQTGDCLCRSRLFLGWWKLCHLHANKLTYTIVYGKNKPGKFSSLSHLPQTPVEKHFLNSMRAGGSFEKFLRRVLTSTFFWEILSWCGPACQRRHQSVRRVTEFLFSFCHNTVFSFVCCNMNQLTRCSHNQQVLSLCWYFTSATQADLRTCSTFSCVQNIYLLIQTMLHSDWETLEQPIQ